jgi:chromosome segregation ATPase
MAGMIRLKMVCVGLAVASAAGAQEPFNALAGFQQNAAKRTAEWATLTTNLEQRVARLLPCDPRIRSAIEETTRASEARIVALTTYWLAVSGTSKSQADAIRRLQAQEEASKEEWTSDRTEAEEERVAVAEQSGLLAISANRLPALANAQKSLTATSQALRQIESQIQARETTGDQLVGELRDLLTASQARQNAIEAQLKFISTEGARWSAYYDARLKRAQTECAITNPGSAAAPATPAPQAGKKQ